jgi:hypothetical protein
MSNKTVFICFVSNWSSPEQILRRYKYQTPGHDGCWENVVATKDIFGADFVVILDEFPSNIERSKIDSAKVIYLQREPSDARIEFLKQNIRSLKFSSALERAKDLFLSQGNKKYAFNGIYENHYHVSTWQIKKKFSYLRDLKYPKKNKKISTVTSSRNSTYGHKKRLEVIKRLSKRYPKIDIYGRGLSKKDFDSSYKGELKYNGYCKYKGLLDYSYSIACENSSHKNYFTEKIIDCFLSWTKPLYWGCKNIDYYFPKKSYAWIDIFSKNVVEDILEEIEKPVDIQALKEARELVLKKYNIWPSVKNIIENLQS